MFNNKLKYKIFEKIHFLKIKRILRKFGANKNTISFFCNESKKLKKILLEDAEFTYQCDPASEGTEEIILTYPGFFAVFCYRIAHILKSVNVRPKAKKIPTPEKIHLSIFKKFFILI